MWFAIQMVVAICAILWAIGAMMLLWEKITSHKSLPHPESEPKLIITNSDGSKTELQLLYSGRNIDELV